MDFLKHTNSQNCLVCLSVFHHSYIKVLDRVAQSAGIGGLDPSIAKDLIDSEDPKHTLFCREIAFVAIYALFRDDISIL